MGILVVVGAGILIVLGVLLAIFARRAVISGRGGTIDMNMRLSTFAPERGWAPGLGRFVGDELRWYRLFSLGLRPRRVLSRQELVVQSRRPPAGAERLAVPPGWVVVRCHGGAGRPSLAYVPGTGRAEATSMEIALAESALTGFLSWLEAAPPGGLRRR